MQRSLGFGTGAVGSSTECISSISNQPLSHARLISSLSMQAGSGGAYKVSAALYPWYHRVI